MMILKHIFNPAVYIPLSYIALILYSLDYILLYQELFAVTIALSNSTVFFFLVWIVVICSVQLYWIVWRSLFFGHLSTPENEAVLDGFKSRWVMICGYMLITQSIILRPFLLFTFNTLVMHLLHKVAEERVVIISAIIEKSWHRFQLFTRLILFIMFAVVVNYLSLYYLHIMSQSMTTFDTNLSYLYHMNLLLCIHHTFSNIRVIMKIVFNQLYGEEDHSNTAYVTDTVLLLVRDVIVLNCIVYLTAYGVINPYLLFPFILHLQLLIESYQKLSHFVKLMRVISQFPLANEEALLREVRCTICYEEMSVEQRCRKLNCGHCFHESCLQEWFREKYTCPYCRADQLKEKSIKVMRSNAEPAYIVRIHINHENVEVNIDNEAHNNNEPHENNMNIARGNNDNSKEINFFSIAAAAAAVADEENKTNYNNSNNSNENFVSSDRNASLNNIPNDLTRDNVIKNLHDINNDSNIDNNDKKERDDMEIFESEQARNKSIERTSEQKESIECLETMFAPSPLQCCESRNTITDTTNVVDKFSCNSKDTLSNNNDAEEKKDITPSLDDSKIVEEQSEEEWHANSLTNPVIPLTSLLSEQIESNITREGANVFEGSKHAMLNSQDNTSSDGNGKNQELLRALKKYHEQITNAQEEFKNAISALRQDNTQREEKECAFKKYINLINTPNNLSQIT